MVCGSGTSCGATAERVVGGTKAGGIGTFCAGPVADSATAGLWARLSKPRATGSSGPFTVLVVIATAWCGGDLKPPMSSF